MGYSHYYTRIQAVKIKKAEWDALLDDVRKIEYAVSLKIPLVGLDDLPGISISNRQIFFNGHSPDDFETFVLTRNPKSRSFDGEGEAFDCCKTGHRPYDVVVCAVLLAVKDRLGAAFKIESDGGVSDWEDALRLATNALDRDLPLRKISEFDEDESGELERIEKELNYRAAIFAEKDALNESLPDAQFKESQKISIRM